MNEGMGCHRLYGIYGSEGEGIQRVRRSWTQVYRTTSTYHQSFPVMRFVAPHLSPPRKRTLFGWERCEFSLEGAFVAFQISYPDPMLSGQV